MTDKILGVYFPKDADLYAQRQTNIYEQFLKALEAIIFGIRGSNMPITPSVIKKAEIEFERHKQIAIALLSEGDLFYPFENAKGLEALYMRENRFFEANKATFLSAVKFGSLEVSVFLHSKNQQRSSGRLEVLTAQNLMLVRLSMSITEILPIKRLST